MASSRSGLFSGQESILEVLLTVNYGNIYQFSVTVLWQTAIVCRQKIMLENVPVLPVVDQWHNARAV